MTIGVRAVIRSEDGKFLLVRHTYTTGWHFPGGGVEPNETVEEALAKEIRQETGLQLVGSPRLHGIYFNSLISKRDHVLTYLCETEGQLPPASPSIEIAGLGYYGIEELPSGIDEGTERRLKEIIEGQERTKHW